MSGERIDRMRMKLSNLEFIPLIFILYRTKFAIVFLLLLVTFFFEGAGIVEDGAMGL